MADGVEYGVPRWPMVSAFEVVDMVGLQTVEVENSTMPGPPDYLRALLWVIGDGRAPVTGRVGQPVTAEVAEVEWWSALAAVKPQTAHLAPLPEISEQLGVAYRRPNEVGFAAAHAAWVVLTWLLGLQDPEGPNGLPRWLYEGSTPSADELFREATAIERQAGASRPANFWAAVYQHALRDAARHRRMAGWMRRVEQRSSSDVIEHRAP